MASSRIFGYGSLLNKQSLLRTSPDAAEIEPAYIKGFKRSFNVSTAMRDGPLKGQPYCALGIEESSDTNVNGVVFTVRESLDSIKVHERN